MLLDIKWFGRFDRDAVSDYALAVKYEFLRNNIRSGYLLRMDMLESGAQTDDALPAFRRSFKWFPKAHRIAIVTGDLLTQQQVKQDMRQSSLRFFDYPEPALRWLAEDMLEFVEAV